MGGTEKYWEYWPVTSSFVIFRHHTGRKRGVYIAIRPDRPDIFISGEFQNPNRSVWWNDTLSWHIEELKPASIL